MTKRINKTALKSTDSRVGSRQVGMLAALAVIGVAAYWNSFDVPFVFDDWVSILTNSTVQLGGALTPSSLMSRSLLYFTFAVNRAISGENVWSYHLFNLLFHLLNGALVYVLARDIFFRTLERKDNVNSFAFLAAGFFLIHPLQTESVTYISSRSELLSTFFYAGAIVLFARRPPERVGFLFSLLVGVVFLLGLGAKETVISLPAALLVYDAIFFSTGKIRGVLSRWRFYATFVVGGAAVSFYLLPGLLNSIGPGAPGNLPVYSYFLTQLRVLVLYVQLLFLPAGLNLAHDITPSTTVLNLSVILSAAFLIGLLLLALLLLKTKPAVTFAIFWFFITLAPTSSFVPLLDVVFEHRMYLPMIGISLVFPLFVLWIRDLIETNVNLRLSVPQVAVPLLIALFIGTIMRNEVWRDETRLWADVIAKSPEKARGYMGLAQAYYSRGQHDRAIEVSNRGIENVQGNALTFYGNIGQFYLRLGRYDEALEAFSSALERTITSQDRARAHHNIAMTYIYKAAVHAGVLEEKDRLLAQAEDALRQSVSSDSSYLPSWDSYINVMFDRGKTEALRAELEAMRQEPSEPRADYGFGKLAFQSGNYTDAAKYFGLAEHHYHDDKMFNFNYAYTLEEIGNVTGAIDRYIQALNLDPLFMEAHINLGQLYLDNGKDQQAIEQFNDVVRADSRNTLAHLQLAKIYIRRGERALARNHLSAILTVSPGDQEAAALWRQTL